VKKLDSDKLKGDIFEYFCKMYLMLVPECKKNYKQVFLYSEIPEAMRVMLGLPEKDKGIDGIVIDNNDNITGFQSKFRSNKNLMLSFGEMSTFIALTYQSKVNFGKVISNCIDVCDEIRNDNKFVNTLFDDLNCNCDYMFWSSVCEHIKGCTSKIYSKRELRNHQVDIIDKIIEHYKIYINGKLLLACGTGKTFISYYFSVLMSKFNKIFIVVPSLYLLSQTYRSWLMDLQSNSLDYDFLLLGSDLEKKDEGGHILTTDKNVVKNMLNTTKKIIVITTYKSSEVLVNACNDNNFTFDFGIFDEAHRTVIYG
jgi:predicted helicase